jgi:hypothetical protein
VSVENIIVHNLEHGFNYKNNTPPLQLVPSPLQTNIPSLFNGKNRNFTVHKWLPSYLRESFLRNFISGAPSVPIHAVRFQETFFLHYTSLSPFSISWKSLHLYVIVPSMRYICRIFKTPSQNCEKRQLALSCLSVRL